MVLTRVFSGLLLAGLSLAALAPGQPAGRAAEPVTAGPTLPADFPRLDYTPFGYIDNPWHSMVFNRSGVIRSVMPLGFGWWRSDFEGNYGGGPRDHVNYTSFLEMSVAVGDHRYVTPEDFTRRRVRLSSAYHTKHLMSYDWQDGQISVSLQFFLPRENTLCCRAELVNAGSTGQDIELDATHTYRLGGVKWWGRDGLSARYVPESGVSISKGWAYGDAFVLSSTLKPSAAVCTDSMSAWARWVRREKDPEAPGTGLRQAGDTKAPTGSAASVKGLGPVRAAQSYHVRLGPGAVYSVLVFLSRGRSEAQAMRERDSARAEALPALARQLAEDRRFWSACPVLEGDWPDHWKRGWVYDMETLRMTVRKPLGIFRHPWDGMQVHSPRMVLGETSLDMMTLSYAAPDLAKEVIEGTFADALMANVPCAREDGSLNMVSADGSECGTAPMWGYPFHVINAIYQTTGDSAWVARLYPRLKEYLEWWLTNRTDDEGWLHCNNSWESGQDGSRRFLVAEQNEGAVADFVRTVDVEASMAEALQLMGEFSIPAGRPEERTYWRDLAGRRVRNVHAMFIQGEFRDIDGRTNTPIILKDYHDVMMLAPVACGVATEEQVRILGPGFALFTGKRPLQWPPGMQTYTEAAWNAGLRLEAAKAVAATAERVYRRTDARRLLSGDPADPLSWRIPGVANEFWPVRDMPAGGENYGWGATLPMFILRSLLGFHERTPAPGASGPAAAGGAFWLAPSIPAELLQPGKNFRVSNLWYRGTAFDVEVRCLADRRLAVQVTSREGREVQILNAGGRLLSGPAGSGRDPAAGTERPDREREGGAAASRSRTVEGGNGTLYIVQLS